MKIFITIALLFSLIALHFACKKNVLTAAPFDTATGKALVKINYSSPYAKNPSVRVRINGQLVSAGITYSTPFPGGGLNTGGQSFADYLSVPPGEMTLAIVMPFAKEPKDSVVLYSTSVNVKADIFQTIHLTDTSANTQNVITEDASTRPDSGKVQYRFVNLIPNAGPIDLYYGPNKLIAGLNYKQASDTFTMTAGVTQTAGWIIKQKDSLAILGTAYTASATSTVANQRVFTVYARGYAGLPTTDIRSPKVSLLFNK
jgi:hypothetical protein